MSPVCLLLAALSCTSPTAPLPTAPNATITGTVVERVDGPPYSFLRLGTRNCATASSNGYSPGWTE